MGPGTVRAAAVVAGVHPGTVRRWIRAGLVRARRRGGRWELEPGEREVIGRIADLRRAGVPLRLGAVAARWGPVRWSTSGPLIGDGPSLRTPGGQLVLAPVVSPAPPAARPGGGAVTVGVAGGAPRIPGTRVPPPAVTALVAHGHPPEAALRLLGVPPGSTPAPAAPVAGARPPRRGAGTGTAERGASG